MVPLVPTVSQADGQSGSFLQNRSDGGMILGALSVGLSGGGNGSVATATEYSAVNPELSNVHLIQAVAPAFACRSERSCTARVLRMGRADH